MALNAEELADLIESKEDAYLAPIDIANPTTAGLVRDAKLRALSEAIVEHLKTKMQVEILADDIEVANGTVDINNASVTTYPVPSPPGTGELNEPGVAGTTGEGCVK